MTSIRKPGPRAELAAPKSSESKKIQRGLLFALPDRILGLGIQIVFLPLIARALTTGELSVLLAMVATVSVVATANPGQGPALSILLDNTASGAEANQSRRILAEAQGVLWVGGLVSFVGLTVAIAFGRLSYLGSARDAVSSVDLLAGAMILLVGAVFNVVFSWAPNYRAASLTQSTSNLIASGTKFASLVALGFSLAFFPTFLVILSARYLIPAVTNMVDAAHLRMTENVSLRPRRIRWSPTTSFLVRSNMLHSVAQVGAGLSVGLAVSVAAARYSADDAATFGVLIAATALLHSLYWAFNAQLAVAVRRNSGHGRANTEIKGIVQHAVVTHAAIAGLFGLGVMFIGPWTNLMAVIMGEEFRFSAQLGLLFVAIGALSAFEGIHYAMALGAGRPSHAAIPIAIRGAVVILVLARFSGALPNTESLALLLATSFAVLAPYYVHRIARITREAAGSSLDGSTATPALGWSSVRIADQAGAESWR